MRNDGDDGVDVRMLMLGLDDRCALFDYDINAIFPLSNKGGSLSAYLASWTSPRMAEKKSERVAAVEGLLQGLLTMEETQSRVRRLDLT